MAIDQSTITQLNQHINFLRELSVEIGNCYTDQHNIVSSLNNISPEGRRALLDTYKTKAGPVTVIRKQVAEILATRDITFEELDAIITPAVAAKPGSFSSMYKHWYNMLYMFILHDKKSPMHEAIQGIMKLVRETLPNGKELKAAWFDFTGERETGANRTWIAFYNKTHAKQSTSKQLFLNIENGGIEYSLFDWPNQRRIEQKMVQNGEPFDSHDMLNLFERNAEAVFTDNLAQVKDTEIVLDSEEYVYKISMSPKDIPDDAFNFFMNERIAIVHEDTAGKGQSGKTQGAVFADDIKIGDYFFLCRGNTRFVYLCKVTSDSDYCTYGQFGDNGWLQRSFEVVREAANDNRYEGENKWWSPNNNSTCIWIPDHELPLANQQIFSPFFKVQFKKNVMESQDTKQGNTGENLSLNVILYGPPGTGKTYNSIDLAVRIAKGVAESRSHAENKADFDALRKEGQIEFVTFHQNYTYEDFMVGLKPDVAAEGLRFDKHKGIFYRIVKEAERNYLASNQPSVASKDFKTVFEEFIKPLEDGGRLPLKTERGKEFILYDINDKNIPIEKSTGHTEHSLSISTLEDLYYNNRDYPSGLSPYYKPVIKSLKELGKTEGKTQLKKYVIVIDEINRANISRVFGELITLVEDDKRIGTENELRVTLPNGERDFGIPPNLYIIGTMNTADKSIALVDIALRRRFEFHGKYPDYSLLEPAFAKLLQGINSRVYSRKNNSADYLIGHAYFMKKEPLRDIIAKKVIPLLMEYFSGRVSEVTEILAGLVNVTYDQNTYQWTVTE